MFSAESILASLLGALGIDRATIVNYANTGIGYMQNFDARLASIEQSLARLEAQNQVRAALPTPNGKDGDHAR